MSTTAIITSEAPDVVYLITAQAGGLSGSVPRSCNKRLGLWEDYGFQGRVQWAFWWEVV